MDVMLNDGFQGMRRALRRLGPEADPAKRLDRAAELAWKCSGANRARAVALLWYAVEVDPEALKLALGSALETTFAPLIEAAAGRVAKEGRG